MNSRHLTRAHAKSRHFTSNVNSHPRFHYGMNFLIFFKNLIKKNMRKAFLKKNLKNEYFFTK